LHRGLARKWWKQGAIGIQFGVMRKYIETERESFRVMSREQMRRFDAWAINTIGIPGAVLMENAGGSCAELVRERLADVKDAKVCIFCGTGNNGGDGYVVARHLAGSGADVRVVICGDRGKIKGDAKINLDVIEKMQIVIEQMDVCVDGAAEKARAYAAGCDMIVDAIFGTGLVGKLRQEYIRLIEGINAAQARVVAVDIPSGLDCDTGEPLGRAIRAEATVTFGAVKRGFGAGTGAGEYTGEVYVASIGIEPGFWGGDIKD